MEEYKLTKEEREKIKEIGLLRIRAKKSVENYKIPDTIIGHIQSGTFIKLPEIEESQGLEEKTKEEKIAYSVAEAWGYNPGNHDGRIKKILEEELNLCKRIRDEDIISIIAKDPSDKSKYSELEKKLKCYIEKKVKPYLKDYIDLLEKTKEKEGRNEKYLKQFQKWLKTGKNEDFPISEGETKSEESRKEDKKMQMFSKEEIEDWREGFNKEVATEMKKHEEEMKGKTDQELSVAEGLKEPEEKKTEEKPNKKETIPKSYIPFKRISSETLIALVDTYLMQDGIAEPGMLKKGYIKCTNEDMQSFLQTMDYDTCKKLDIINCSEENSRKLFEAIKPRHILSIDMYYGDAVLKDTKTGKSKILDLKLKNYGKS